MKRFRRNALPGRWAFAIYAYNKGDVRGRMGEFHMIYPEDYSTMQEAETAAKRFKTQTQMNARGGMSYKIMVYDIDSDYQKSVR